MSDCDDGGALLRAGVPSQCRRPMPYEQPFESHLPSTLW